ncbi:MAG: hypothetical protein KAG34_07065 [Cocleimonas sp.]|nr:hypothetical protein [Cocleimonas sp.]
MKTYNYSTITLNKLEEIFNIEKKYDRTVFNSWFGEKSHVSKEDLFYLQALRNKNIQHLDNYTELELISKFIAPILNRIDFEIEEKKIRDWYEIPLKYESDEYTFNGRCDFVVAKGYDKPISPYFFIQEFKQTSSTFPEYQLLAEMIVAIEMNQSSSIKGAYIIGSIWVFVIADKKQENQYHYTLSKKYDAMEMDDLNDIYHYLQRVKRELL